MQVDFTTHSQAWFKMYRDGWLLLATCMILLMQSVSATWHHWCSEGTRRRGPHRFGTCGNNIDEVLWMLCGSSGYSETPSSTRFRFSDFFRKKRDIGSEIQKNLPGLILPRMAANSYLSRDDIPSRQKRSSYYSQGIVCECCYHMCTLGELSMYCKTDKKRKRSLTEQQMKLYSQNRPND